MQVFVVSWTSTTHFGILFEAKVLFFFLFCDIFPDLA